MERNIFDDLAAQGNPAPTYEPLPQEQQESFDVNGQYPQEQEVSAEQPQEQQVQPAKPTPQQSFQEMRLKTEQLQRERDDALRVLQQVEQYAMQQKYQQQPVQQKEQEQYISDYSDDDIVEGRHLKNEIGAIKQEFNNYKKQQEQWLEAQRANSIELQLKSKYNDFDKVMTHENISKLRELKPEIASTLHQSTDIYNKASATYTLLKELGIYQSDTANPDIQRAHQNIAKPRPVASVSPQRGDSALSHANSFSRNMSEADKRKVYATMVANSKNR